MSEYALDFFKNEIQSVESKHPEHFKEKGINLRDVIDITLFDLPSDQEGGNTEFNERYKIAFFEILPNDVKKDLDDAFHKKLLDEVA